MKPIRLSITNFRSFRDTQHFFFPQQPGLYFLWGENREEPRLDANGSGKTSLWEALTWLLYGKTSRGLKAGDVANWDRGKGTVVEFEYLEAGQEMPITLRRTWSPNALVVIDASGQAHDVVNTTTLTRIDLLPFLHCVMMAQGQPMFLDLKADAKASLFAEVMLLDRWLDYSQKAADRAREVDGEIRRIEGTISKLQGQLEELRVNTGLREVELWEVERKRRIARLESDYARILSRRSELQVKVQASTVVRDDRRARLRRIAEDEQAATKKCATCGQALPNIHTPLRRPATEALDNAESLLRSAQRELEQLDKLLDDMEQHGDVIAAEVNPHQRAEEVRKERMRSAESSLQDTRHALDEEQSRYMLYAYWVRGYKDIRLSQIEEVLAQLEVEVNSCISLLGLRGWEVYFDLDRETKSGTVQRGFSVTVQSPHNDRPVPWEAWSGGESQRLRVATNMGLANLIRSRTDTGFALEVWDEPTNWMSPQGVTDLLNTLADRAVSEQRQIWVVDHRTLGFPRFKGSAGVIKTAAGQSIFNLEELPMK